MKAQYFGAGSLVTADDSTVWLRAEGWHKLALFCRSLRQIRRERAQRLAWRAPALIPYRQENHAAPSTVPRKELREWLLLEKFCSYALRWPPFRPPCPHSAGDATMSLAKEPAS